MTHAGKILRKINDKMILARAEKAPKINAKVYDSKGKIVGSVYEVFGPVKNPYILIRILEGQKAIQNKKETIYFGE
ncbi:MAG: Gar1/Naf1 family protein [Candidatus Methanomethylicia archaeon]